LEENGVNPRSVKTLDEFDTLRFSIVMDADILPVIEKGKELFANEMRLDLATALLVDKANIDITRLKLDAKEPIELEISVKTKNLKDTTAALRSQSQDLDSKLLNGKHTSKLESIEIFHSPDQHPEAKEKSLSESLKSNSSSKDKDSPDKVNKLKQDNQNLMKIIEDLQAQHEVTKELNKNMNILLQRTSGIEESLIESGISTPRSDNYAARRESKS